MPGAQPRRREIDHTTGQEEAARCLAILDARLVLRRPDFFYFIPQPYPRQHDARHAAEKGHLWDFDIISHRHHVSHLSGHDGRNTHGRISLRESAIHAYRLMIFSSLHAF